MEIIIPVSSSLRWANVTQTLSLIDLEIVCDSNKLSNPLID